MFPVKVVFIVNFQGLNRYMASIYCSNYIRQFTFIVKAFNFFRYLCCSWWKLDEFIFMSADFLNKFMTTL